MMTGAIVGGKSVEQAARLQSEYQPYQPPLLAHSSSSAFDTLAPL